MSSQNQLVDSVVTSEQALSTAEKRGHPSTSSSSSCDSPNTPSARPTKLLKGSQETSIPIKTSKMGLTAQDIATLKK